MSNRRLEVVFKM